MSHVKPLALADEKIESVILFGVVPSDAEVICVELDEDIDTDIDGDESGVEAATPEILKKLRRFE